MGPPPLVAVGLRQETLDLVLLLQSLGGVLDPTVVNLVAMTLKDKEKTQDKDFIWTRDNDLVELFMIREETINFFTAYSIKDIERS